MLNFKVVRRDIKPFGRQEKEARYFAQRVVRGTLSLKQVEEQIVQKTSLAKGDVRNAITSLAEVVNSALLSGLRVDLGDLGSFAVEAGVKMMKTPEEVNATTIRKPQIRYTPKHEMRKYAQAVGISVDNPKGGGAATGSGASGTPSGGGTNQPESSL